MTTVDQNIDESRPVSGVSILLAALASAFAPGFFLGLALAFVERPHFAEALLLAPLLSIAGGIVGAPFAALIFAPAIAVLRQFHRLNWFWLILIGFCSVFVVGLGHCVIEGTVATGVGNDAMFALCGAIAGFSFWLMTGDVEKDIP